MRGDKSGVSCCVRAGDLTWSAAEQNSSLGHGCGGGGRFGDCFEAVAEVAEEALLALGVAEVPDGHLHVQRCQGFIGGAPALGHEEGERGGFVFHGDEVDVDGVGIIGIDAPTHDGEVVAGGGVADGGGDVAEGSGGRGDGQNPLSRGCCTPGKKGESGREKGEKPCEGERGGETDDE